MERYNRLSKLLKENTQEGINCNQKVKALFLSEYLKELEMALCDNHPFVLWKTRQWQLGDHPFFNKVEEINKRAGRVIFVIDAAVGKDKVKPNVNADDDKEKVIFSNDTPLPFPLNQVIGRNHIRIHILGEKAYLSAIDFAQYAFNREELVYKVTDSELVQWLKIAALNERSFSQPVGEYIVHRANGREKSPIEKALRSKIKELTLSQVDCSLTIVSSWIPDAFIDNLMQLLKNNQRSRVNIIIRSPTEFESIAKLPFTLTKMIAYAHLGLAKELGLDFKERSRLRVCRAEEDFHAKFAMARFGKKDENEMNFWWLVGTDNFTRFGYKARTSEFALEGTDSELFNDLKRYINYIGVKINV